MHWGEDGTWWRWNTLTPPSQTELESRTLRAANKQLAAKKQPKAENCHIPIRIPVSTFNLDLVKAILHTEKTCHFIRGNTMCDFIPNLFHLLRPRPCWEEGNCTYLLQLSHRAAGTKFTGHNLKSSLKYINSTIANLVYDHAWSAMHTYPQHHGQIFSDEVTRS